MQPPSEMIIFFELLNLVRFNPSSEHSNIFKKSLETKTTFLYASIYIFVLKITFFYLTSISFNLNRWAIFSWMHQNCRRRACELHRFAPYPNRVLSRQPNASLCCILISINPAHHEHSRSWKTGSPTASTQFHAPLIHLPTSDYSMIK